MARVPINGCCRTVDDPDRTNEILDRECAFETGQNEQSADTKNDRSYFDASIERFWHWIWIKRGASRRVRTQWRGRGISSTAGDERRHRPGRRVDGQFGQRNSGSVGILAEHSARIWMEIHRKARPIRGVDVDLEVRGCGRSIAKI